MKRIVIAPVGDSIEALFVGIKEFPTEKVILITPEESLDIANKAQKELEKFKIPVIIKEIKGNLWEEMFKTISEIKSYEPENKIIINVATGDKDLRCAATSAAFVNGLKAFSVAGDQAMLLPILKFSYYKLLTEKKLGILRLLSEPNCCSSLEEISKRTNMSLPLISYHINGTLKSDGLKQLGLIDIKENKGKLNVNLSTLGRLLINGYI